MNLVALMLLTVIRIQDLDIFHTINNGRFDILI